MMNTKKIDNIINKVVGNRYEIQSHFSKTTSSYYVNVCNGEMRVQLRFSDHLNKHNKKSKTFIVNNSVNEKSLEGFIRNRVRMLQTISLYNAFDKVEGKLPEKRVLA